MYLLDMHIRHAPCLSVGSRGARGGGRTGQGQIVRG
jgi:hypothetical protein